MSDKVSNRSRVFNTFIPIENIKHAENIYNKWFANNDQIKWFVGQIENENENLHIQCVWGYDNARYLSSLQKYFGKSDSINPSHIQVTKDVSAMVSYCSDPKKRIKQQNEKEILLFQKGQLPEIRKTESNQNTLFEEAIATGSYQEAIKYIENKDRRWFAMNMKKIQTYLQTKFPTQEILLYSLNDFNIPPIDKELMKSKTIVLIGEPAFGKTSFALAHFKRPALIRSRNDYSKINDETDGLVIDDISFRDWKPQTLISLIDLSQGSYQDIKYGSVFIRPGLPRFICLNREIDFWPKDITDDGKFANIEYETIFKAINRRIIGKYIEKPLYDVPDNFNDQFNSGLKLKLKRKFDCNNDREIIEYDTCKRVKYEYNK